MSAYPKGIYLSLAVFEQAGYAAPVYYISGVGEVYKEGQLVSKEELPTDLWPLKLVQR